MGSSWYGAVLGAGVLVLTGCSGFVPADGTSTETVSPFPVPSPSATRTAEATVPPGVANGLVTNPGALWRAHRDALSNASYAVRFEETVRYANGSTRSKIEKITRVSRDGLRSRSFVRGQGEVNLPLFPNATRVELYIEGEEGYARARDPAGDGQGTGDDQEDDGQRPRYARIAGTFETRYRGPPSSLLFVIGSMELQATRTRRGNGTAFRVVSTELVAPVFLAEALDLDEGLSIERASLRATVAPSGLVRKYRLNYTLSSDGTVLRGTRSVRYRGIGSTDVDRPLWIREAIDAAPVGTGSESSRRATVETPTSTPIATPSAKATDE